MTALTLTRSFGGVLSLALIFFLTVLGPRAADAQVSAFMQGVAEAAASDRDIAEFYKANGYKGIWTGAGGRDKQRRSALLKAVSDAHLHGLPEGRYDLATLRIDPRRVRSERELGQLEVAFSRLFLQYARDVQTGVLEPSKVDREIARSVPYRSRTKTLAAFQQSSPKGFIKALPPQNPEYARLMKEKLRFEKIVGKGGWGQQVQAKALKPGETGGAVVQLRNRLIAMGYLRRTASPNYDDNLVQAVARFQRDHGLLVDGVAGPGTLGQINIEPTRRLTQIIVSMERARWTNMPLGKRHVWVNIPDYTAKIIDNGKVTFETRSVVGEAVDDQRTPEFSDVMEHMVINPTWNVPRSIAVKEYLPLMQRNPYAAGHLLLKDARGRTVPRAAVNFRAYTERTFPFDLKQPPSNDNALGLVKFMFPNKYNIYLHDTPSKSLFGRERRAFSHGCIRLADPFDFAYTLLARQSRDPVGLFQSKLKTGRETVVPLEAEVPVHLVYRTAFTQAKGNIQFRADVYGRDAKIWKALERAGVSLLSVQG